MASLSGELARILQSDLPLELQTTLKTNEDEIGYL